MIPITWCYLDTVQTQSTQQIHAGLPHHLPGPCWTWESLICCCLLVEPSWDEWRWTQLEGETAGSTCSSSSSSRNYMLEQQQQLVFTCPGTRSSKYTGLSQLQVVIMYCTPPQCPDLCHTGPVTALHSLLLLLLQLSTQTCKVLTSK